MVVAGVLHNLPAINVLAGIGKDVRCYDTKATRIKSKLGGSLSAFAVPKKPNNTEYYFDDATAIDNVVAAFFLSDVPMPCMSFMPGAILVGNEPTLREALKGRKFFPRALWRDLLAVEIQ